MTGSPSVPRDKFKEKPLVPISGERLRAVIEFRNRSVRETAAGANQKQQTIDYIVQGKTKRCRQDRRQALADILDVSSEWLGGEAVPPWPSLVTGIRTSALGEDRPILIDENLRTLDPAASELPPTYQLYWAELVGRVLAAWRRDIDEGSEPAVALARQYPNDFDGGEWPSVSMLIQRTLGIFWWRRLVIVPNPLPVAPPDLDELDPVKRSRLAEANLAAWTPRRATLRDENAFAKSAAIALGHTLEPWLAGDRSLDYEAVTEVLDWLCRGLDLEGIARGARG